MHKRRPRRSGGIHSTHERKHEDASQTSWRVGRVDGSPTALRVEVEDDQRLLGETKVSGFTNVWKTYTAMLRAGETSGKARLNILLEGSGTVDIDLVSLYPKDTWQNPQRILDCQ